MKGDSSKLTDRWVLPIITKTLINNRWHLNGLIDAGRVKPTDMNDKQWDTLVRNLGLQASQKLFEHMCAISKGNRLKVAHMACLEKDALVN